MQKTLTFHLSPSDIHERLDTYLSKKIPEISRSQIKKLIDTGNVLLNNHPAKAGRKLQDRDVVHITIPEPKTLEVTPQKIPLDILYEDKSIIVVNKPAGMVVHAGAGNTEKTLVNALLYHCKDLSGIGGVLRPGIVHRLDKDTSGAIVAAKNDKAHLSLTKQFKERIIKKKYIALVWGVVKDDEGIIDMPIGRHISHRQKMSISAKRGRSAVTHYKVLKRFSRWTLLEIRIETGRTHQIRVHLSAIHHPVVGDTVYGKKTMPSFLPTNIRASVQGLKRQALHAATLGFKHPETDEYMEFNSPLPKDMDSIIKVMENSIA
ncbi:MAG: RluA family pseudouridine synthase [Deltaproteobacteria bacterium]|nr:RluA family pseudouridine synthase [Deltaproteobacteria bacterium]